MSEEKKNTPNRNLKGSDTDVVWPESEEELNAIPEEIKQKMLARQIEQKRKAREERRRTPLQIVSVPTPATDVVIASSAASSSPSRSSARRTRRKGRGSNNNNSYSKWNISAENRRIQPT